MGRSTVVMAIVFVAVAAGVWLLQTTNPPQVEGAPTFVLEVNEGDVTRLDLQTSDGSTAFERIEPFGWKFASSGDQTDFNRVSSVVNRLAKLRSQAKVLDKVADLAPYQLNQPTMTATLTVKDGSAR